MANTGQGRLLRSQWLIRSARPGSFGRTKFHLLYKNKYDDDGTVAIIADDWAFQGSDQTLVASLFTNTNTFYSGQINLQVTSSLFTNSQTFFGGQLNLTIVAGLYTNPNTFFSGTVASSSQTVIASLFTNTNTLFSGQVNLQVTAPVSVSYTHLTLPTNREV